MPKVDTNRFSLDHDVKLSFSMGELVPTCVIDTLPGDKFSISVENMLRFLPLIAPVMHKVNVRTHFFFVPNRIVFPEWEKFIVGEDVEAPYFTVTEVLDGSLLDYLGVPTGSFTQRISVFPVVAYLQIWNQYYRDQNLQDEYFTTVVPGEQPTDDYEQWAFTPPPHCAWEHDYFTSSLPFAQAGDAVVLPLTQQDNIRVDYGFNNNGTGLNVNQGLIRNAATGNLMTSTGGGLFVGAGPTPLASGGLERNAGDKAVYDPNGTLTVDVQSEAVDINTLRRAFRLQEFLETSARAGRRLKEFILGHFGVVSSDARLQRPEYIGGSKQNMIISEVLSTAKTEAASTITALGQLGGHGISVGGGNRFNYNCEEHGFIIGLINVQPTTAYQDGLHRMFTRDTYLDYAFPKFANIGEQVVKQKEIWAKSATPEATFGYVPRYAEYKFMNSRVAGEMRGSLHFWTFGRTFASEPHLNSVFVACNPSKEPFAVTDPEQDEVIAHVFNNVSAVRKLPKYGIPTI